MILIPFFTISNFTNFWNFRALCMLYNHMSFLLLIYLWYGASIFISQDLLSAYSIIILFNQVYTYKWYKVSWESGPIPKYVSILHVCYYLLWLQSGNREHEVCRSAVTNKWTLDMLVQFWCEFNVQYISKIHCRSECLIATTNTASIY